MIGGGAETRDRVGYWVPPARRGRLPQPAEAVSSSVPGRHLGRLLRAARAGAGLTVPDAAQALGVTAQKLGRIESAVGVLRGRDVRALCELYGASPETTAHLVKLAGEVGAKGWWHTYGPTLVDGLDLHAGLVATACRLREYQDAVIPPLLQTRGYASALLASEPDLLPEPERERLVAARLDRQSLLHRSLPAPPRYAVLLSEVALRAEGFGAAVMAQQLRELVEVGRLPDVSIRVLPLAAGLHPGAVAGPFTLLDFPSTGLRLEPEPPVVYRPGLTGELYLDREEEIAAYEQVWATLEDRALDEQASQHLISEISERDLG